MHEQIERYFQELTPRVDFFSLRLIEETTESLCVRQNILQPVSSSRDRGAMLTVIHQGGVGYASTSDLSRGGLQRALDQASQWAAFCSTRGVSDLTDLTMPATRAHYTTPVASPWDSLSLPDKITLLSDLSQSMAISPKIVDWKASLTSVDTHSLYLTNTGGRIEQTLRHIMPNLVVYANQGTETIRRSLLDHCHQGGLEVLERIDFKNHGPRLAREALQLLDADNCPEGTLDLVLAPDQMMLQIHESIGHPLELDRILGDERNYAGTSFVSLDMFGNYQYGSPLLNVSFDPTVDWELGSYGTDDEGLKASKEWVIEAGLLKRPLGGTVSQFRANHPGVACSRASSWNRPPIDRMANLNVEPGSHSFEEIISQVERGVYMQTNLSWSIDDSRNKFQFGCESGQLIENGELTRLVKNPSYRGISATFWRNLKAVGDTHTAGVYGTPYCGKGEPNQVIRVGHASPTCLFEAVDVFGGE